MRYEDWDVLLFPSGREAAQVPAKEFRTACYLEQKDGQIVPLLTTLIPSFYAQTPFQISIHSWTKTGPRLIWPVDTVGPRPREMWQVKIIIDSVNFCSETFPVDVSWPQIIASTTPSGTVEYEPAAHVLRFPEFHDGIMSQSHWDPSDRVGRIRVELSLGWVDERSNRFKTAGTVVVFAFQHAPMDVLRQCGVAWPHPRLAMSPLMSNASIGFPATLPPTTTSNKHKKIASADNIGFPSALTGLPFQPLPASLQAYTFDVKSNYDGSSRSTSGYSLMPDSAGPLLNKGSFGQAYPGSQAETTNKYTMRFRSDQFDKLIKAIKPETEQQQQQQYPDSRTAMPPPPLPAHAVGSKDNGVSAQPLLPPNEAVDAAFGSEVEFIDRRAESRYSDVSMHAGCNGFPTCTTEDADGRIVHNTNATNCTPAAPAPVVRGRKEGSSPTKPRDFRSTILDTPAPPLGTPMSTAEPPTHLSKEPGTGLLSSSPADLQGKKRTRSALRSLNINDGSPEKKDAVKPPRKASKASVSEPNKEIVSDGQENMLLDA